MAAWLSCQYLMVAVSEQPVSYARRTITVVGECAHICLGTLGVLQQHRKDLNEVALLCLGICEECAEVCERYPARSFQNCAAACRQCAASLGQLLALTL